MLTHSEIHAAYVPLYRRFEASDFQESEAEALLEQMAELENESAATKALTVYDTHLQADVACMARGEVI